jgi:hypothetical protein
MLLFQNIVIYQILSAVAEQSGRSYKALGFLVVLPSAARIFAGIAP